MSGLFENLISEYGYAALFVFSAFDHTGTPAALLVGIGLASSGIFSFPMVFLVSFFGGLVGDWLFYAIGLWGGRRALNFFLKKRPEKSLAIKKAEEWFLRFGGGAVLFGRFFGFVGRPICFVSGLFSYSFIRFTFFSFLGGVLMTAAFGFPGVFAGEYISRISENKYLSFYLFSGFIVLQLIVSFFYLKWKIRRELARVSVDGSVENYEGK